MPSSRQLYIFANDGEHPSFHHNRFFIFLNHCFPPPLQPGRRTAAVGAGDKVWNGILIFPLFLLHFPLAFFFDPAIIEHATERNSKTINRYALVV